MYTIFLKYTKLSVFIDCLPLEVLVLLNNINNLHFYSTFLLYKAPSYILSHKMLISALLDWVVESCYYSHVSDDEVHTRKS